MLKPTLLDCTLRDGGNQNDWRFTAADVQTIVSTLDSAEVDVIEVGYRGGSGSRHSPTAGASAHCSPEYLAALPVTKHAELAVMVVPSVCPVLAMEDLPDSPVSMVRLAAYPWNMGQIPAYMNAVRSMGLRVSVNLMAVSYVDVPRLREIARELASTPPDVMYVADSFGALNPDSLRERVDVLLHELDIPVGVHTHNNLGLAAANALAALDTGATWLDASLCAMARGAGNLATEQAAAILSSWPRYATDVLPEQVCEASEYVAERVLPRPMAVRRVEIAAGLNDHHFYYQDRVDRISAAHGLDPWRVGRALGAIRPRKVTDEVVERVCQNMSEESPA
ncbi:4-hydroxy-2-oxovalerate aldolase [Nocardiopsis terrae]|uniref:4-hydroxy 2-oxovalerate aldolase n=1 Tax=Nocardiopsis terrae TaxID=372655 RepID=A0ABR9HP46_9ACTN|nr:aldolase [Nocardiopsis terrae]MBE1460756.1 4-hydroxy 2-oxovalerate aldolase [Nocardiopsis terrae]GHC73301.1 4-hydroxy-2-oxovalerate aldolase [Nocardiopsis terrae]